MASHHHCYRAEPLRINLCWQLLLTASLFGAETCMGFYQVYAILFLQTMGVPKWLLSLDGIVTGIFSIGIVLLMGFITDKGDKPKTRKLIALMLGMLLMLLSTIIIFTTVCIRMYQLNDNHQISRDDDPEGINITLSLIQASPPIGASDLNQTATISHEPFYYNHSVPTTQACVHHQEDSQTSGIPTTAVLAIAGVSLLNMGFDASAASSRAFMLVSAPSSQQTGILTTGTVLQSISGTIFSALGIVDLPNVLGALLGIDGISATFLFITSYMFLCVFLGFVLTAVSSHLIEQRLDQSGYQRLDDDAELAVGDPIDQEGSQDDVNLVRSNQAASVHFQNKLLCSQDIHNATGNSKNGRVYYSSTSHGQSYDIPKPEISESHNSYYGSRLKSSEDVIDSARTTYPQDKGAPRFRITRKLFVLCVSYFFSVGGLITFVPYMPTMLTVEIYHGDPDALPGTDGYALYQKGLKMAAVGNLVFYTTFFITSIANRVILRFIRPEVQNMILSVCFVLSVAVFVLFQNEAMYFVAVTFLGPYRTCIFTIPYMLAAKYSQEGDAVEQQQQQTCSPKTKTKKEKVNVNLKARANVKADAKRESSSNMGQVMSLIGILMPIHYFVLSTFMGPVIESIGNFLFPIYYSLGLFLIGLLAFSWLLAGKGKN